MVITAPRPQPAATAGAAIDIRHVTQAFRTTDGSDLPVLDDVTLSIAASEFVALVGPS